MAKESLISRLIDILGGNVSIASRKLKVDRQVLDQWIKRGKIPHRRGEQIEKDTDGKITKLDVWLEAAKCGKQQAPKRRHP